MSIFLKKTTLISLILIAIIAFQNNAAFGQTASSLEDLNISISPSNPRAGDSVILNASSYSINMDSSKITWYVDGVAKKEGVGQKNLTIRAKGNGQSTAVRVTAEATDGTISKGSTTITAGGVDIIVEPTSYIPRFYKGKPIFVSQGSAKIVAIPNIIVNGKKISSKNLIFKWQKDDVMLPQEVNIGNDYIIINGGIPIRDININVEVEDSSGATVAQTSRIISASSPQLLFYENSPLYGELLNKAVIGYYYLRSNEELDIIAKPYFFNIASQDSADINYSWSVNGNSVSLPGKKNVLVLKQTDPNLSGTASISLDVNNLDRIFQYTTAGFDVDFGK